MGKNHTGRDIFKHLERHIAETEDPLDVESGVRHLRSWMDESVPVQEKAGNESDTDDTASTGSGRLHRAHKGDRRRKRSRPTLPPQDETRQRPRTSGLLGRKMSRLLVRLAGADPEILDRAPVDRARYIAMGWLLVCTALVAVVSGALAIEMATQAPPIASVTLGAVWGFVILCLDRFLVVTVDRPQRRAWQRNMWRGFTVAAPRVLLALVIGLAVAQPIVLQIFERDIDVELQALRNDRITSVEDQIDKQFADVSDLEEEVAQRRAVVAGQDRPSAVDDPDVRAAQREVDERRSAWQEAERRAVCERDGSCGTALAGQGAQYRQARRAADEAQARLESAERDLQNVREETQARINSEAAARRATAGKELETLEPQLREREAAKSVALARAQRGELGNDGILVRLAALNRLGESDSAVRTASLALLLLLASIELLPVLAKLLINAGPTPLYEVLLRREQERQAEISAINHEVVLELERDRAARQIELGKVANAQLVALQEEKIARQALVSWPEQHRAPRTGAMPPDWVKENPPRRSSSSPPLALPPSIRDVE